jgi:hypothetical protein
MKDKAYTVKEIDDLRRACETRWLFGSTIAVQSPQLSRSYGESEKTKCVEEIVRTYMLAGIIAEDLYNEDRGLANKR